MPVPSKLRCVSGLSRVTEAWLRDARESREQPLLRQKQKWQNKGPAPFGVEPSGFRLATLPPCVPHSCIA